MSVQTERRAPLGPDVTREFKIFGPYKKVWTIEEAVDKFLDLETPIYRNIAVRFPGNAQRQIQQDLQEGYAPCMVINHQSHYDGRAVQKTLESLLPVVNEALPEGERSRGCIAPIATSIGTGDQDALVQSFFSRLGQRMEAGGFYTVDFTREKDEKDYKLERSREMMEEFNAQMNGFLDAGLMLAVFPEATLKGGRLDPRGRPFGMQPFEEKTMQRMRRFIEGRGKPVSFIPIGVSGTYKVLSPDAGYRPPGSSIARAKLSLMTRGLVDFTGIAKATIGDPIRWDTMRQHMTQQGLKVTDTTVNAALGKYVSELVPLHERGVYAGPLPAVIQTLDATYKERRAEREIAAQHKANDPLRNETP
jgi:hypothetical protein